MITKSKYLRLIAVESNRIESNQIKSNLELPNRSDREEWIFINDLDIYLYLCVLAF